MDDDFVPVSGPLLLDPRRQALRAVLGEKIVTLAVRSSGRRGGNERRDTHDGERVTVGQ